ncbi:DUF488 domain-containing protein [Moraxella caviae]|uniref:DUF488 domain-containing protein n=1 Tax=Moraxella caviae TaxID=34060 RepID=UPI001A94EACD|nr:DUF488 family protein [Moraxella caviae]
MQRIYDFIKMPTDEKPAVFIDRLYPRGVQKAHFARLLWLKSAAPSHELRQWFHRSTDEHAFATFSKLYTQELTAPEALQALAHIKKLHKTHGDIWLITAVKDVARSHIPVLLAVLGEKSSEKSAKNPS